MTSGATFSENRVYRYELWREWWADTSPTCVFIGLNPSTANEEVNDPTIRRCIDFAKRLYCGRLVMLNLYAYRATDPRDLDSALDPIGPDNDKTLKSWADRMIPCGSGVVIAAWGAGGHPTRIAEVCGIFDKTDLACLGKTAKGAPRHPLYVRAAAPLAVYRHSSDIAREVAARDALSRAG
jgi:hypothetical protein